MNSVCRDRRAPALLALMALAAVAAPATAQTRQVRQLQVTSSNASDVYVDAGRAQGLTPGMTVRLFPPGAAQLELEVRSVSSSSARLALPSGMPPPPVGTRGEFEVALTTATAREEPASPEQRPAPEHPPWQRDTPTLADGDPLLAFAASPHPAERPMTLGGRIYGTGQWNRDQGPGRDADYLLARIGMHATATNALGQGERIRFAGEVDDRVANVPGRVDEQDLNGRIDLMSVAFGTESWAPLGVEIGRMRSRYLPEIGLLDGVEGVARFQDGIRVGAGFGALPRPFPARDTGEDVSTHLFIDYESDPRRAFAAAFGVQKTWHKGTADRDLLVLRAEGRPSDELWLYAGAKVDYYTGDDLRKSGGLEVTEMMTQARYDEAEGGVGLMLSHFAWPDLLRREYQSLPDELVRDGKVDRASLSGWHRLPHEVRLSARADYWQDQNGDGTAFELGGDWNNAFEQQLVLNAALTWSDGGYQSGPGARLFARRRFGDVDLRAGYRWYRYDLTRLVAQTETLTRQSFELGAGWAIGDCDLDVSFERWFGDDEDAYVFGIYSQWRF